MAKSQNGYAANDVTKTKSYKIPGTERAIRLRIGSPGELLVHLAAWFDKNIEDIEAGQLDDWGYAERPIRGQGVEYDKDGNPINLSNHASGTAEDLNSVKHPLGKRGTFTMAQTAKIRTQLKLYDGCIRWGGDYTKRADEMHFEIVRDTAACDAVLKKLTTPEPPKKEWDEMATEAQVEAAAYKANSRYAKDFWTATGGTGTALIKAVAANGSAIAELAKFVKADDIADDAAFAAAMTEIRQSHTDLAAAVEKLAKAATPKA